MAEDETKKPEPPVKPTRADIREALRCPVCKTAGALSLSEDKCHKCGSFQNAKGEWETPDASKTKHEPGSPWFDWRD